MKLIDLGIHLKEHGIKNIDVASFLDVSEKAVSEWVNGKAFPNDKGINYLISKLRTLTAETNEGTLISLKSNFTNPSRPLPTRPRRRGQKAAAIANT